MASPYGHTLAGLSLFNFCYPGTRFSGRKGTLLFGLVILTASLPDLDFLPGLFLGQGGRFHHGYFHSLGAAGFLFLLAFIFLAVIKPEDARFKLAGFILTLILSHLFLDYLTEAPKGFPLFWPLSEAQWLSPLPLLPRVERDLGNPTFFRQALFCFSVESFLFIPLWAASSAKKSFTNNP